MKKHDTARRRPPPDGFTKDDSCGFWVSAFAFLFLLVVVFFIFIAIWPGGA